MSKTKFKVGDLIKGLSASDTKYLWTSSKMHLARVIKVYDSNDEMRIEIIKHERNMVIGSQYTVANDSTLFGLVEETCDSKVVIYCKGKDVIAKNTKTGETAKATCHPDDPFDFNIGCKLAFERLMNPTKIVKQDKYKIGDKVKIVDKWVRGCFQNGHGKMDKYLGTVMTIRDIGCLGYTMIEDKHDNFGNGWYWSNKCIEGKVVTVTEDVPKKEEPKLYNGKVVCVDLCGTNYHNYTAGKIYEIKDGKLTTDSRVELPLDGAVHSFKEWEEYTSSKFIEVVD